MSGCILLLANSHSPVFLLNSCLDLFSAPPSPEDPLSRGYGVSLPSSLTVSLPSASVYSTQPRVSVYGTGGRSLMLSGFSREHDYPRYHLAPEGAVYCRLSAREVDFPASLCTYGLQPPFPSGGGGVTSPSPRRTRASSGILTASAIGDGFRLALRTRLTRGRLASPRKPWSFGGGESHPPYRYLYLHLPFQTLQNASRHAFHADWNAPLPTGFPVPRLRRDASYPIIIHAQLLDQ